MKFNINNQMKLVGLYIFSQNLIVFKRVTPKIDYL